MLLLCLGQGVTVQSELIVLNTVVLPHKELTSSYKNQIILWTVCILIIQIFDRGAHLCAHAQCACSRETSRMFATEHEFKIGLDVSRTEKNC